MNVIAASVHAVQPALALHAVSKSFNSQLRLSVPWRAKPAPKHVLAVNDVSFQVERGEIFGVLGANGSGKSTLIRVISTLLLPDAGSVQVFGLDVVRHELEVKQLINRVSVDAAFFKKLSPMENLLYAARLYGLGADQARHQGLAILEQLGISRKVTLEPMEEMSRGMQQKVAIARALLTSPVLLLLDEPTTGLDPRSKKDVQRLVLSLREEHDAMWSYLSGVFDVVAETIAWERWEGTIEYTLMAPVRRSLHLIGTCSYAVTYSVVRALVIFIVVALLFGVSLTNADVVTALVVVAVGSLSVIGLAIVAAVLPLLFTERGAQMTFVIHSSLLLISGVYAPVEVLPTWLQVLAPLSPMTYVLRSVRAGLLEGAPVSAVVGDLAILLVMGAVLVPGGLLIFRAAERYARRTGRLKRSG